MRNGDTSILSFAGGKRECNQGSCVPVVCGELKIVYFAERALLLGHEAVSAQVPFVKLGMFPFGALVAW